MLCALAPALASAQTTDATRYTNAQGVEVIQNRPPAPLAATAAAPAAVTEKPANTGKPAKEAASAHDARFQIAAREQNERDRDRLAILRQELLKEMEDYQTKSRILHSPSMKSSLTEEQLQRLQQTAHAHEQNIRDLNAEINRTLHSN